VHIALYLSLPLARNFAQAKELHGLAVVPQPLRDRRPRHIHGLWVVELVGGVEPRELYLFGVNSAAQAVNIAKHVPAVRGIGLHRHLSAALAPAQLGHLAEPPRGASASTPSSMNTVLMRLRPLRALAFWVSGRTQWPRTRLFTESHALRCPCDARWPWLQH